MQAEIVEAIIGLIWSIASNIHEEDPNHRVVFVSPNHSLGRRKHVSGEIRP